MLFIPIETPIIRADDDIVEVFLDSIRRCGEKLVDGDILVVADKVVAVSEGRTVYLEEVEPSSEAIKLSKKHALNPQYVELILREADEVYGGVEKAILTLKKGVLIANAGIDHTNVPIGHVSLWSQDPNKKAVDIRNEVQRRTGVNVGVLLVDSRVHPLRMGTTAFALGVAGLEPIQDLRGKKDLYGKTLYITRINVADDLAAASHLLMSEADEGRPLIIVRETPVKVTDEYNAEEVKIPKDQCLYFRSFRCKLKNMSRD
ncbi:MAG: coenzyme F420-0:L-glutamate ligase [Nitrososphaeria archaeon]|nr:coenzyme F420-0:L-glutamate ligase [Nitrososphaeria archaeon]NIN52162.1 coenzyme F420-0:L-glutamate ligase [Nitrososphaeria archaeon]NIQ32615.1 coenzyme F420-0:L-glutamate ligase [Nitrososphaeria archaeon]